MQTSMVTIGNRKIGPGYPPFIIAEIGGNFATSEEGKKFVDAAVTAGADAVKFQTYRADTVASKKAMFDMPNVGKMPQWEYFRKTELSEDMHSKLFSYAAERGIMAFSSPSHESDVELLEKFNVPAYKIGSDDAVNVPFIEYVAKIGKPAILSTGMCTLDDVEESVKAFLATGNKQLVVLHCVAQYPTEPKDVNLRSMVTMQRELEKYGVPVGWSDHTMGIDVSLAAAALGASAIEKHFTIDKTFPGADNMHSADPEEMKNLVEWSRRIYAALGSPVKKPSEAEMRVNIRENRKSIVAEKNIPAGAAITRDMIAVKRPGTGILPRYFKELIGRRTKKNIETDDVVKWEDLE